MIGYVILSIPNKAFINHHVLLEATGATVDSYRPEDTTLLGASPR